MNDAQWQAAEAEWQNPDNWRTGHYVAPLDPRIWVRKREPRFGWTFNFAQPMSWVYLACMLSFPFAVLLVQYFLR